MKKKKKMSLEHEFYIYKENHKYFIIQLALKVLYDEGIYEEEPLLEKYKDLEMDNPEKADLVANLVTNDFQEEYENGNTENYDRLYKVCWNRIKNRIPDNRAYDIPNAI